LLFTLASCDGESNPRRLATSDTTMAVLHTGSGRQCHINTYRQASYGHDQRIEAFGSKGLLLNDHMRTRTESATKTPL